MVSSVAISLEENQENPRKPIRSFAADVIAYRNAIIHYYETEDYSEYADYFLSKLEGRIE